MNLHGEKLTLSEDEDKGKIEIPAQYASKLVSLQRFGIRFLFKQFITKQPGVLLNDPSGYGKRVQVILFLDAIKSLLSEPILIVCQNVERWQQELHAWLGNIDEVAINAKSFINKHKMYYITKFDTIKSHISIKWSVIVIDYSQDDLINNYGRLIKGWKGLKGQFVVWISSHDIKLSKHLPVVCSIFEWMDKDFQNKFEAILSGVWRCKCDITKAVQLDRAFQDLYLRRDGLENKFFIEGIEHNEERPKITKKNKDSTGMKIKKSKRKINDEASSLTILEESKDNSTMSDKKTSQNHKVCIKKKRSKRIISSSDDDDDVDGAMKNKHDNNENNYDKDKTSDSEKNKHINAMDSQDGIISNSYDYNEINGENKVLDNNRRVSNEMTTVLDKDIQERYSDRNCSHKDKSIIKQDIYNYNEILTQSTELKVSDNAEVTKNNFNNYEISNNTNELECDSLSENKGVLKDKIKVIETEDKVKDKNAEEKTISKDVVDVIDELDELEKTVYKKYKGSLLDLL